MIIDSYNWILRRRSLFDGELALKIHVINHLFTCFTTEVIVIKVAHTLE